MKSQKLKKTLGNMIKMFDTLIKKVSWKHFSRIYTSFMTGLAPL